MSGALIEAGAIVGFLVLGSGYGLLVPREWRRTGQRRGLAADFVVGALILAAVYGTAVQLNATLPQAIVGTFVFLVIGGVCLVRATLTRTANVATRALIGATIGLVWIVSSALAGNAGAADPWSYAALPFLAFSHDWIAQTVDQAPGAASVMGSVASVQATRAAATTALWPIAALGRGLGVAQVTQAGVGLLIVSACLLADMLRRGLGTTWAAVAAGVGGVGLYNVLAILTGGQVQQAFALTVVLASVWLATKALQPVTHLGICMLGGYVLAATYPEFLVVLPLYVLALAVELRAGLRWAVFYFAAAVAGWALDQVVTLGQLLGYVVGQSGAAPGWAPLPRTPESPLEIAVDLVLQTRPPLITLPLVAILSWFFFWRRGGAQSEAPPVQRYAIVGLVGLAVIWAAVIARSGNLNYSVFKLGGWIGPGLLLIAVPFAASLPASAGRAALTVLVGLAVARTVSLAYGGHEVIGFGRVDLAQTYPRYTSDTGGCVVHIDERDADDVLASVAGSAAPYYGCQLQVDAPAH
jgi:hypothetical protein